MGKKISRLGIYQELDKLNGASVEEWLDEKKLLDWEFVTISEGEIDDEDYE
jgi:hypothetical protein